MSLGLRAGLGSVDGAGTLSGGANRSLNNYPHPYFDLSSQYIPSTVKEMFRWCQYLYLSHSEITPAINKKCAYAITDLVYKTDDEKLHKQWYGLLEGILNIRQIEYELSLDYEVYGNAFCSIYFPFDRYLECPKCKTQKLLEKIPGWRYVQHKFKAICTKQGCKYEGPMSPIDRINANKERISIRRWNPEYMNIRYNHFSGVTEYIYKIPTYVRKEIATGGKDGQNCYQVATTPLPFLAAIKENKDLKFRKDAIYHMKNPSISTYDMAFGLPPLLPVFKDAWLHQTYRRAQEAIAVEHVLPLRLLIPEAANTGTSPHQSINLVEWQARMNQIIHRWRRDPNAIFTVPFASRVENIGGDAQALNVHNDMQLLRQQIVAGLDMPPSVIFGDAQFSGASVTLRMLENVFIGRITALERFLNRFVVPKLSAYLDIPEIIVKHRDFKMADDVQQKQIALNLRQTNTISDQTVLEELGFDYSLELQRRKQEERDRNDVVARQMVSQAEAQGRAMIVSAEFEAKSTAVRDKAMQEANRAAKLESSKDLLSSQSHSQMMDAVQRVTKQPVGTLPAPPPMHPEMLSTMADNFLKSTPVEMVPNHIEQMKEKNPALATAILNRQQLISKQVADMRPLPDQKPPRRESSPI